MDILNADLVLSNDFDKWARSKKAAASPKKKTINGKSRPKPKPKPKRKRDEEESGYHFIAYVPINGVVWRLDGLQRQPINIGTSLTTLKRSMLILVKVKMQKTGWA
jgi:ubiquitin carboxyl-terminal hydrolase L5